MTLTHLFHKSAALKGLAVTLWIVTSILALFALNGAADVVTTIVAAFWAGGGQYGAVYQSAVALRQVMLIPGSILTCIVIIGSMEYHLRHFNTPGSWRLFGYILGAEAGILLLAAML